MIDRTEAEDHLRVIRSLMEKATIYRALSAPAALIGGLLSVGASVLVPCLERTGIGTEAVLQAFYMVWSAVFIVTAIASLVLGLVSMIGGMCITAVPAIICGHMALSRQKRANVANSKGLAIAGLILGYVLTLASIVAAVVMAFFFTQVARTASQHLRNAPDFQVFAESADLSTSVAHANLIYVACSKYAALHNGEFPRSLSDLEPDDLVLPDALSDPLALEFGNDGYFYFRPTKDSDESMVIIASRGKTSSGERAVVRKSGATSPEKWNPPADL